MPNVESDATPFIVRRFRAEDIDSCRGLWVELTDWHRDLYSSPAIGGPNPSLLFDELLGRVGADHVLVAEIAGRVVGLAGLIPGDSEGELEPLVVSGTHRGHGIGKQLVRIVIDEARDGGMRQLKVRPVARNEPAIRFFHRLGFDILGQLELFMDLGTRDRQRWKNGPQLAGRNFRY